MSAEEKEISFKEFISKITAWVKYLFSKWLIIGFIAAACPGMGLLFA